MWRFGVENFTEGAQTGHLQMLAQRFETLQCGYRITADAIFGQCIVPQQPRPHCTLVVSAVPLPDTPFIARSVGGMFAVQGAQADGGEQMLLAGFDHGLLCRFIQRAVRQADGKDLVGTQAGVVAIRAVQHVV